MHPVIKTVIAFWEGPGTRRCAAQCAWAALKNREAVAGSKRLIAGKVEGRGPPAPTCITWQSTGCGSANGCGWIRGGIGSLGAACFSARATLSAAGEEGNIAGQTSTTGPWPGRSAV